MHTRFIQLSRSGGGPLRQVRRVIENDGVGSEPGTQGLDHFIDDIVVGEDEMHGRCAAHGVRGRACHAHPEFLERACLARRPIPHSDLLAAFRGGFDEGAAEQACSEIGSLGHDEKLNPPIHK
jgi:hypothetical protein